MDYQTRRPTGYSTTAQPESTARSVANRVSEYGQDAENVIVAYPESSVLITLGLGFGMGLLLSSLVVRKKPAPWYDRYIPDAVSRRLPEGWTR